MRTSQILELVYADISRPTNPMPNNKKRNMISLIDNYSHTVWVLILGEKLELFITFEKYKNQVEKAIRLTIKGLHTDCGNEFTSLHFTDFFSKIDILKKFNSCINPLTKWSCRVEESNYYDY